MMRPLLMRCGAAAARRGPSQFSKPLFASWQASRKYSITPEAASLSQPQDIDPSKLVIEKTSKPGSLKKPEELVFGANFTG